MSLERATRTAKRWADKDFDIYPGMYDDMVELSQEFLKLLERLQELQQFKDSFYRVMP